MPARYHCAKFLDTDGPKDGICGGVYRKISMTMTKPFQWDSRGFKYDSIFDGCRDFFDGCNSCTPKHATGVAQCTRRRCYKQGKAECRGYAMGCNINTGIKGLPDGTKDCQGGH